MQHVTDSGTIRLLPGILVLGAILVLGPAPAARAQQSAAALGEVVVTARKKEESLQQTPVTMTATVPRFEFVEPSQAAKVNESAPW